MATQGWVSIHRQIQDSWLWDIKPFSEGQAWIDLILRANHTTQKVCIKGKLEVVDRGSLITSIRKLSERWGWDKDKVSRFLNNLETDGMIVQNRNNRRTLLRLTKYDVYQCSTDTKPNAKTDTQPKPSQDAQTDANPKRTIKSNDNTVKNDNKYIGLEARLFGEVDKQLAEGGFN